MPNASKATTGTRRKPANKPSETDTTTTEETPVTSPKTSTAPAFDLAALAANDGALIEVVGFGTNSGKSAEPSAFKPHVKQSYDRKQAYGFNVPTGDAVKATMNELRRAARQLGLGIGFDNKELDNGTTDVRFKAKDKTEQRRRSDAEKIAVIEWARANGRMVQVAGCKVNDDGTVDGRISSNVYASYDLAMAKAAKDAEEAKEA